MSSSYFTNESLKSGWKYFHDKFVGDDKPVFNFAVGLKDQWKK